MIAEEWPHHMGLVRFEASLHHRGERIAAVEDVGFQHQRCEGQGRRAFEVARHQEAPGWQGGKRVGVGAARLQIGGE